MKNGYFVFGILMFFAAFNAIAGDASFTLPPKNEAWPPNTAPTFVPSQVSPSDPQSFPTQVPRIVPTPAPQNAPTQAPQNAPMQAPQNAPMQAPQSFQSQAPQNAPMQAPQSFQSQAPQSFQSQAPQSFQSQAPVSPGGKLTIIDSGGSLKIGPAYPQRQVVTPPPLTMQPTQNMRGTPAPDSTQAGINAPQPIPAQSPPSDENTMQNSGS